MSTPAEALAALGDKTMSGASLSVLLKEPPGTTLGTLKRARARGLVIQVGQQWQAHDVRADVRHVLKARAANGDDLFTAAAVVQAPPHLGYDWREMQALLSLMAAEGDIECWFGAGQ